MLLKKKLFALVCLSLALAGLLPGEALAIPVPLHHYMNYDAVRHFYTTNYNELGWGNSYWSYEGFDSYIENTPGPGLVPLYRYYHTTLGSHYYTIHYSELGEGKDGWVKIGIQGYVAATSGAASGFTAPMYMAYCHHPYYSHFFTSSLSFYNALSGGSTCFTRYGAVFYVIGSR